MEALRLKRLRAELQSRNLPAMLITYPVNRKYMTGFTGSSGVVIVTADHAYLITDFRYRTQAPAQAKHYEVIEQQPKVTDTILDVLRQCGVDEVGFEQDHVSYSDYVNYREQWTGIQLTAVQGIVERLREVKDEAELQIMREAADLADRTFSHLLGWIRPGMQEREVALEMEIFMRRHGASSSAFDTIVASGERSALPHGTASDKLLALGEFVTFDFGAYYRGYCSDLTRTIMLGQPTERHREIYDIVREAQAHALEQIRPGMTGREADALARDIIARYGYADQFGHGTGHGLGMEIHEAPRLSKLSETVLVPGMVVTVEPGIYIPGFGGVRIEDDVVITDTGIEILTHSVKELLVIQ